MSGSSPNSDLSYFFEILCFFVCFFGVQVSLKIKMGKGVGGWCLANPSFSRIFRFFKLNKTP